MPLAHTRPRADVMPRPIAPIFRRRTTGPKKSRVRPSLWPLAFYIALCLAALAAGLLFEEAIRTIMRPP